MNNKRSPLREISQVFNDWVGRLSPKKQDTDISEEGNKNLHSSILKDANSDAVFIGWQKTTSGDAFPLYNITAKDHPHYLSTVSEQTLRKMNIKIPPTTPFEDT
ncbi:MAG: hypothetical protein EHM64_11335 [Ignavibacteriae bacterium]|nr:MAG: hypothetical protein EHM64_11335 [Ignavibacteriota bacterium]